MSDRRRIHCGGCGCGGIAVIQDANSHLLGATAVTGKDYASSLLANAINADLFLISNPVEKVALNQGKPGQVWLDGMTLAEARKYLAQGHFAKASMSTKIQAIVRYLAPRQGGSGY